MPRTTVLPSAHSNMNLFGCLMEIVFCFLFFVFFSRGSVVNICTAFGFAVFVFSVKVLSNTVDVFLVSKAF